MIVGSPAISVTSRLLNSWLMFQHQTYFTSFWVNIVFNWRAVSYLHDVYHYCTLRIIMVWLLLVWFIGIIARWDWWLPSSFGCLHGNFWYHKKAIISGSRHSGQLQLRGLWVLFSEVYGFFSNKVLSSLRATTICFIFGGRETPAQPWPTTQKRNFHD